ncbi:ATP-dependent helicase [Thalassomonas viridans]|uniref:DNA 3'-5' helicase n=1 Tax=Thalassomonas viridans TaxID=137584 RepID=A0AAE9Z993_9GAMM|nr:ATP-dependent helicase [Thalassomonas viridans]WDE09116.1 ATP-dependent helicase [Thalassomonas viridans]
MLATNSLNTAQAAAAAVSAQEAKEQLPSPLLIIAGAGTGKTNTLAHRAANLLLQGASPERILLMTFARRAAGELASRANRIVEQTLQQQQKQYHPVKIPWMGTFHAIAGRLLREHAESIGLSPDFTILDRNDAADMLDLLRHELGYTQTETRFPKKKTCLEIYSRCVNAQQGLEEVLERYFPHCKDWQQELTTLFARYAEIKINQVCLDYDDLLLYCFHMAQVPEIAARIRAQFDHILVDEYQDTNVLQAGILTGFFPTGEGLTVVGDDAQSIYGFRAATVDNILGFPELFTPKARVISLTQNYRSHQHILDLSNILLEEGSEGYKVALFSDNKTGPKPKLVTVEDDARQAEYIVKQILDNREQGTELKQQAVLFRSSHHSDRLELELTRRNIPYVKHGGLKFLEAAHVKDLLSILRWADNPKYRIGAFRILKLFPGVGPKTADKVLRHLEENQYQLSALADINLPAAAQDLWPAFVKLLNDVYSEQLPWTEQVAAIAVQYRPLLEQHYEDHFVRYGDIEQLMQISQQFPNRERFLSELTLDPPQSSGDLSGAPHIDDDFLHLSTVHSAKGQEWREVFILNIADGNFPNEYATGDKRQIEEERRLLNVAITRAKTGLHLMYPLRYWVPEQQKHGDQHVYGAKSRFLTEAVMQHLEPISYPQVNPTTEQRNKGQAAIMDIKKSILGMWK